jgi:hypothetical protein
LLTSFAPLKQPRRVSQRSALRAPTSGLRSSPKQKSPAPGAARREAHEPGGQRALRRFSEGAFGLGASLRGRRRGAQGAWPRARRASTTDLPRLFERSERSERSEFCGRPRDRAPERSLSEAKTAEAKRRARPERGFAAPTNERKAATPEHQTC